MTSIDDNARSELSAPGPRSGRPNRPIPPPPPPPSSSAPPPPPPPSEAADRVPLPAAARSALDEIERTRSWNRFRLDAIVGSSSR